MPNDALTERVLTYLRATRKTIGLVLFFGPSPQVERVVL